MASKHLTQLLKPSCVSGRDTNGYRMSGMEWKDTVKTMVTMDEGNAEQAYKSKKTTKEEVMWLLLLIDLGVHQTDDALKEQEW